MRFDFLHESSPDEQEGIPLPCRSFTGCSGRMTDGQRSEYLFILGNAQTFQNVPNRRFLSEPGQLVDPAGAQANRMYCQLHVLERTRAIRHGIGIRSPVGHHDQGRRLIIEGIIIPPGCCVVKCRTLRRESMFRMISFMLNLLCSDGADLKDIPFPSGGQGMRSCLIAYRLCHEISCADITARASIAIFALAILVYFTTMD